MSALIVFIQKAIAQGIGMLFGATGEIITEKSGNLNLGVEGMMYMGGAMGLGGAFYYEMMTGGNTNGLVAVLIAILFAFLGGAFGALIYSFITITLRANQNVTGLALAIFGTGAGQFIGEYMRVTSGGYVAISNELKAVFQGSPFPAALQSIPVAGPLLFSYNIFVYLGVAIAVAMAFFFNKSRPGLHLRAVGESPATADAAGINVTKYKYLSTVIGGGISAIGGMVYITTIAGCVWNHEGLSGEGWLAVALVIAAAFPYVIYVLRDVLSIEMPVNLVFLLMFCFVLVVLLSLSIAITQLAEKCKRLTQANAILEKRVRDLEEKNR